MSGEWSTFIQPARDAIPDALRRRFGRHYSDDGFGFDWETDPLAEAAASTIETLLASDGSGPVFLDEGPTAGSAGPDDFEPVAEQTHRLAQNVGGHPIIPLPVQWHMGAHGDPIAVFDCIVLHLHRDGSVTWSDQSQAWEATDGR